mmetsp:Transcript_9511/g.22266  ORF Transcript_9511/g.22266 Transcript_9511/m.22266 type:complete len:89 (+) Transcript_9511:440-706(+)
MREIHEAMVSAKKDGGDIVTIPVLFEGKVPGMRECWPAIEDKEGVKMINAINRAGFFALNSIPAPPHTVLSQPSAMHTLLARIEQILK